jgi:ubiquinone biosynthesis accessory factor UbiK
MRNGGNKVDVRTIDEKLTELAQRLSASLPEGMSALKRDAEQNFKAVLQSALTRMDLVSRREFDVQAGVLKRTREKLEAMEQRLALLEQRQ